MSAADLAGIVDAALLVEARSARIARVSSDGPTTADSAASDAVTQTRQAAHAVSAAAGGALAGLDIPVDWSGFGHVIPVVGASAGVGTSVTAAVVADALQLAAVRVLLVDTADPARSGLAAATRTDGRAVAAAHEAVWLRSAWRADALVLRLQTSLAGVTPGMVPLPCFWCPPVPAQATVVDVGFDGYRAAAHPLGGAGAWMRRGVPVPRPLLVVRASRPSLAHAEQVLARWEAWAGCAVLPLRLVVSGARRWPAGVAGAAGRRVQSYMDSAVFLPGDPGIAVGGVTAAVTPQRLRRAVLPLLHEWGVIPGPAGAGPSWRQALRTPRGGAS